MLNQGLLTVNVQVNIEAAPIRQWFIIVETWFLQQVIIQMIQHELSLSLFLCLSGGEAQANRAHSEWEADSSGCQLSFSGAVRVLIQGTETFRLCVCVRVCVYVCVYKPVCGCVSTVSDWIDFLHLLLLSVSHISF